MCGVYGAISSYENIDEVLRAITTQQNRGSEACGIGGKTERGFVLFKGEGDVDTVFNTQTIEKALRTKSQITLGHNRYITTEEGGNLNAQPHFDSDKRILMSHNGHVANYHSLRNALEGRKTRLGNEIQFESTCDSELIANYLSFRMGEKPDDPIHDQLIYAFGKLENDLNGATANVFIVEDVFGAYRHSYGIRPLQFGIRQGKSGIESFGFSSETVPLEENNYHKIRPVNPGELFWITKNGEENIVFNSKIIKEQDKEFLCFFEPNYFSLAGSILNGKKVNETRYDLGDILGEQYIDLKDVYDVVTFIPETPIPAAVALAKVFGKELKICIEKKKFVYGRNFQERERLRTQKIKERLIIHTDAVVGKNVAVVDDSYVRGDTSRYIIEQFKLAGAKRVDLFLYTPPIFNPCFYGIDMPTKDELAAGRHNLDLKKMAEDNHADNVYFISLENLIRAHGTDNLCTACITHNNYPVSIKDEPIEL